MTTPIILYGVFMASKVGKTGLTPTVNVRAIERSTGTVTTVATGASATTVGDGVYAYQVAAATPQTHDYIAVFVTADATVDAQNVQAIWPPLAGAFASELANLDAAVSTRNAVTPPTAGAVADAVWDEALSGHATAGSAGAALSAAGGAADPLLNAVPGSYANGTAGYALGRIASGLLTVVQPVLSDGFVRIVGGSTYKATIGTAIDVSSDGGWPSLPADAAIKWLFGGTQLTGSRVDADTVRLELTAAQSAALLVAYSGRRTYDITATWTTGDVFFLANEAPCLIE